MSKACKGEGCQTRVEVDGSSRKGREKGRDRHRPRFATLMRGPGRDGAGDGSERTPPQAREFGVYGSIGWFGICSKARMLPSVSLNQAVLFPPTVATPCSVLSPGRLYSSNLTPFL